MRTRCKRMWGVLFVVGVLYFEILVLVVYAVLELTKGENWVVYFI